MERCEATQRTTQPHCTKWPKHQRHTTTSTPGVATYACTRGTKLATDCRTCFLLLELCFSRRLELSCSSCAQGGTGWSVRCWHSFWPLVGRSTMALFHRGLKAGVRSFVRRPRSGNAGLLSRFSRSYCHVHEVTARDGIQNEAALLSVEQRVELVRLLVKMCPSSVEGE